jgi:AcrR family transcriptional regulator
MQPSVDQPSQVRSETESESQSANRSRSDGRSQKARLIEAMIELAARDSYQSVSISQLSSHAGVSSATFYEQFGDKEACAVAAFRTASERILAQVAVAPSGEPSISEQWAELAEATLRSLLEVISRDSSAARLLFVEPLGGGARIAAERKGVMRRLRHRAEEFLAGTPVGGQSLDLPPAALMGGLRSIVSRHLRASAEHELPDLAGDILAWIQSYSVGRGRPRWSSSPRARLSPPEPSHTPSAPRPRRLPRGRHRLPPSVVARSHRTRIIHATAEVTRVKGYANATVKDIVSAAGVSRQVFYDHFSDKQHAFLEAQQYPTQYILDTCASAYFASELWPERVWSCVNALLSVLVANPALSHLRLVECYAAGPVAARRAEEITRSFTIFLEEGYHVARGARRPPRVTSQAVAGAIFEIVQRYAAGGEIDLLPILLPQLSYIAIAPFTGAEAAIELVTELTDKQRRSSNDV